MNSRVIATLEATAQPTFDDMGADEVAIHSASGCDLMIAVEKCSTCRAVHLDRRERLTSAHDGEPTGNRNVFRDEITARPVR
jgi:hypothetical protein